MHTDHADQSPVERKEEDVVWVVEVVCLNTAKRKGPIEGWEGRRDVGEGTLVDDDFAEVVAGTYR
jgi:hypothetical protein